MKIRTPIKNTHSRTMTERCRVASSGRVWLLAALLAGCVAPIQAQPLITSFEESEGFALDQSPYGRAGWDGTNIRSSLSISDEFSKEGVWSLKAVSDVEARADSPNLWAENYIGSSFWFINPTATHTESTASITRFYATYGTELAEQGRVQLLVRFGRSAEDPLRLAYIVNNGGPNSHVDLAAGVVDIESWNRFEVDFNFAEETFSVRIGDTQVLSGIGLGANTVTEDTRLRQVWFWTPQTGTAFYDDVQAVVIPEPGAVTALLGLASIGVCIVLRRRCLSKP